jgi:hypothetical protein
MRQSKIIPACIVLAGIAALSGCRNAPSSADFDKYPVSADLIDAPAQAQAPRSGAGVTTPAQIRAYRVGRYVDSADSRIMHESHWVFRRESDPQFVLFTADEQVHLDPPAHVSPNYAPAVLQTELAHELARQREINARLSGAVETTVGQVDALLAESALLRSRAAELGEAHKAIERILDHIDAGAQPRTGESGENAADSPANGG